MTTDNEITLKIGPQPPLALGRGHAHSPDLESTGSISNLEWRRRQMSLINVILERSLPKLHEESAIPTQKQSPTNPLDLRIWSAKLVQVHVSTCLSLQAQCARKLGKALHKKILPTPWHFQHGREAMHPSLPGWPHWISLTHLDGFAQDSVSMLQFNNTGDAHLLLIFADTLQLHPVDGL